MTIHNSDSKTLPYLVGALISALVVVSVTLYANVSSAVGSKLDKEVYVTDRQNISSELREIKDQIRANNELLLRVIDEKNKYGYRHGEK